nr:helix-turn-helix domain-containing protein [Leeuwenhoekiella aestuarii]
MFEKRKINQRKPYSTQGLQISPGTLQNLRINGTIPFTKVGGIIYYDAQEIQQLMEANRIH